MSGQDFAGYTITRRLPNGGLTQLCIGVDAAQRRFVIRRLRPEYAGDRRIRAAFQHGGDILARLSHPNIVRLVRSGVVQEQPFMIVEYIDGQNMRDLILSRSPLLQLNPVSMMREMATALAYLHFHGIWHLDFKPENLMVRADGWVVLIDFDLATERKPKPIRLSPLPGTFAYLPPEALAKGLIDDQTDIYAFGVTCYELLTAHKPFEGITLENSHHLQRDPHAHPKPLRLFNVHVSPSLERLIFKCLAHHQGDRYPSMSLVQRDLETMV